jgi:hypothetical protein
MGRVLTNATTLQVAAETTLGVQPTTGWRTVEPTTIGKYGPTLTKLTREPISKNRQRRKGALTDLDSTVEFEADLTFDHFKMFAEGLMFATAKGGTIYPVTAVTATGYTVASGGAIAANTLVYARGFLNSANNGLKVVVAASIATEVKAAGLVAEATAPSGATIEICGVMGAVGDFQINALGNVQSTAFDWTTAVGAMIQVGQVIWVGSDLGDATHNFATAANRGFARVMGKTATVLTVDKKATTFVTDAGAGKNIYILFGQYIRNVAVDHADYLERTYQFELGYENLGTNPGDDMYEYAKGNFCNDFTFDFQTASKSTMKCSFVGIDCDPPTAVRATGAATPTPPIATAMFNTSVDFLRLRVTESDETALTSYISSMSISVKNNVTPEKVLGKLGGQFINAGLFDVEVDASVLFTDAKVLADMRNNATCTMEAAVRNNDGAIFFDIPAMTIEGGDKDFPVNQTVKISMKSMAFQHPTLGSSLGCSTFPYLPSA